MPHLRFSRDNRGYENTFVVHAGRRRGKAQSRILYWFRTPPGVRVGRAALDEEAIRLIEEHNPDVEFDWTRILKAQVTESRPVPGRERGDRGERPSRRQPPDRPRPPIQRPGPRVEAVETVESADLALADAGLETGPAIEESIVEPAGVEDSALFDALPDDAAEPEPLTSDQLAGAAVEAPFEARVTAAHARLGSEGVSRLRARYAEVLARISERSPDPARAEELKAQAERLNPDTWVTEEEVTLGLEQYETVFESLRAVVGRHRKRRRRRPGGGHPAESQAAGALAPAEPESAGQAPREDEDLDGNNGAQ